MERGSVVDAQIEFEQQENLLWVGIEEYKRPAINSQDSITGIVEASDNRMLLRGLQRRSIFNPTFNMGYKVPPRSKPFKEIYGSAQ